MHRGMRPHNRFLRSFYRGSYDGAMPLSAARVFNARQPKANADKGMGCQRNNTPSVTAWRKVGSICLLCRVGLEPAPARLHLLSLIEQLSRSSTIPRRKGALPEQQPSETFQASFNTQEWIGLAGELSAHEVMIDVSRLSKAVLGGNKNWYASKDKRALVWGRESPALAPL